MVLLDAGWPVAQDFRRCEDKLSFVPQSDSRTLGCETQWLAADALGFVWAPKAGSFSFAQEYQEIVGSLRFAETTCVLNFFELCSPAQLQTKQGASVARKAISVVAVSLATFAQVNAVTPPRQQHSKLMLRAMVFCSVKLNVSGTLWHSGPATQMSLGSTEDSVFFFFENCCGPPREFQLRARTQSPQRAARTAQDASVYSFFLATRKKQH